MRGQLCFALSGLTPLGALDPGAALPWVALPQAGLWLPLRGGKPCDSADDA